MSKEFVWTDELIIEFFQSHFGLYNQEVAIQKLKEFKVSKQSKKEWEVLAYRFKLLLPKELIIEQSGDLWNVACNGNHPDYEIYAVKRHADGKVFKIGDVIAFEKEELSYAPIMRFEIDCSNKSEIWAHNNAFGFGQRCKLWKKRERKFLFKTEDGVEVFDDYTGRISTVYHDLTFNYDCDMHQIKSEIEICPHFKISYFSTKDAAKEYIILNKRCLSLAEVINWYEERKLPLANSFKEDMKLLVANKMK